jgi:hypothetical protein
VVAEERPTRPSCPVYSTPRPSSHTYAHTLYLVHALPQLFWFWKIVQLALKGDSKAPKESKEVYEEDEGPKSKQE